MQPNHLVWKISGEAGYGITAAGTIFAKCASRGGLAVFGHSDIPSRIRGGHCSFTVRVEPSSVSCQIRPVDLLVALNERAIREHAGELWHGGGIIYDKRLELEKLGLRPDLRLYPVPLAQMAELCGEHRVTMNAVALGASIALLRYDLDILKEVFEEHFRAKGRAVIDCNIHAARAGFDYVARQGYTFDRSLAVIGGPRLLMDGNEALALGAIAAGCKFHAQYPMTPVSPILHYMAEKSRDHGIVVVQPEDEIAAINMAIGAGYAGVRSMCASSGGGFSLMVEGVGLAGESEIPVVIIEGQRAGPSTGLPTKTEQGDLRFVLHSSQGEFPKIVLAPGDVAECFYTIAEAFNLAERWQCPVFVLVDRYLVESPRTLEEGEIDPTRITLDRGKLLVGGVEKDYLRYALTEDGVSPRTLPGTPGGMHPATADEHDERGQIDESPGTRTAMMNKRMAKLRHAAREITGWTLRGDRDAELLLIGWGSTKGPIMQALGWLDREGVRAGYLQLRCLSPFPDEIATQLANRTTICIENNYTGQLAGLIKEKTAVAVSHRLLKYDGQPFFPEEIYDFVRGLRA